MDIDPPQADSGGSISPPCTTTFSSAGTTPPATPSLDDHPVHTASTSTTLTTTSIPKAPTLKAQPSLSSHPGFHPPAAAAAAALHWPVSPSSSSSSLISSEHRTEEPEQGSAADMDQDHCKTHSTQQTTLSIQDQPEAQATRQQGQLFPAIPSELILHIFKFLTSSHDLRSALLVSKFWCSCGIDLLWSRPALLSLSIVQKMSQTLSLIRSRAVFPYAHYIRRLNFTCVSQDLTDEELLKFSCCTRLERLLLPGCSKITEKALRRILRVGRGLYSLDLSDIPAVTDAVLEQVAVCCPKLHTIYLTGCEALTDDSIATLAKLCPSLKRIKLAQCVLLTNCSIMALTRHCPQLMEMDVTNCKLMTNSAIQSVFKALPQIRDINMTLLPELTDDAFQNIPFGATLSTHGASLTLTTSTIRFEQLRVLNLTSCVHITDETLARVIPAAPRLRNLTLTKCDRITDAGASVIKVLGKHLHYLHLGHCSKLTDKAITTLTQHCTRIRYLDLACCSKLTDAAVFAMAQLPKLRRIGLVKCANITDHGIYAMLVSQIVPQTLERVHLSYCVHLSDTAVAALVSQCSKLTHLSVTGVPAFMTSRYQKFCRVPPSEFTPHQREVFCVFSGKGVRELRQFMQDHPTLPPSTLASIQRSYRIMGSSVASMVAGGQHSATILAHLGLTLRETESHVQSLAVQSGHGNSETFGFGSTSGGPDTSTAAAEADTSTLIPLEIDAAQQSHPVHEEVELFDLDQPMAEFEQIENDYVQMMLQQSHLLHRYHHRHHRSLQPNPNDPSSHPQHQLHQGLGPESSSNVAPAAVSCLYHGAQQTHIIQDGDVCMTTTLPTEQQEGDQRREDCDDPREGEADVDADADGAGGSSGGSGHGSPTEDDEEEEEDLDVDDDLLGEQDQDEQRRSCADRT
ncbi:SCF ubiquitin ligase complex subunit [Mortierella claussenii]|nr:SCF ubiquitin ligase complex subunit [Mortierella claussenii]